MTEQIDAVVVGAGPAGSAAAAILARGGLATVLLAGRRPVSRHWTETTSAALGDLLPALGVSAASLGSASGICRWRDDERPGCHIDRAAFDAALRDAAVRAGAQLVPLDKALDVIHEAGRIVAVRIAGGRTLPCRLVIDATGVRSQLSRGLALEWRPLSPPLTAWRGEVRGIPAGMADDEAGYVHWADGWAFLATWRGHSTWTCIRRDRQAPALPADLAGMPVTLRPVASNASWRLARPAAGVNWLLAGDAAGQVDPIGGQGLLTAVTSGIAAGRAAVAWLKDAKRTSTRLHSYDAWFADRTLAAAGSWRDGYAGAPVAQAAPPFADPVAAD